MSNAVDPVEYAFDNAPLWDDCPAEAKGAIAAAMREFGEAEAIGTMTWIPAEEVTAELAARSRAAATVSGATMSPMTLPMKQDPVTEAVANAPMDDCPVTDEERRLIDEVRNDPNPVWVDGDEVSARLAERARRERR